MITVKCQLVSAVMDIGACCHDFVDDYDSLAFRFCNQSDYQTDSDDLIFALRISEKYLCIMPSVRSEYNAPKVRTCG